MTEPSIGFVLLTHDKPQQTLRLVGRLNALYGDPAIVCHHDFSKCSLDGAAFPSNVEFVRPAVETQWGTFSLVDATLLALRQLMARRDPPEWFVLLSGADYPAASGERVRRELKAATCDAFVKTIHVHPKYPRDSAQIEYARRYLRFTIPLWRRQVPLGKIPLLPFGLTRQFSIWRGGFECYVGSQWFTANRKSAEALLNFFDHQRRIVRFFRGVPVSDESFLQTVICNSRELRVNPDNLRYIEMVGAHAKVMTLADLPAIVKSKAHFVRKVDAGADAKLLDELDALTSRGK